MALLDSGLNSSTEESLEDDVHVDDTDGRKTLGNGDTQITALFVTASSSEEAKKIAHGLLDRKLVACVNMLPQVTSVYTREGKVEESQEVMMIIKVGMSDGVMWFLSYSFASFFLTYQTVVVLLMSRCLFCLPA